MAKGRQILLYVIGVYMAVFGIVFLLAPDTAEDIMKATLDPSLRISYGAYALIFALAAFMAARSHSAEAAHALAFIILVLLVVHVLVFAYLLLADEQEFAQAGPPIIVNAILAALLVWLRGRPHPDRT